MKRTLWFALGAGSSVWAQRAAKKRMKHYTPPAALERAKQSGVKAAGSVRDAIREGRAEAADYRAFARGEIREE